MTIKDLRKYTIEFDDVKSLIEKQKSLKRQVNSFRRRLKTVESKYSFLQDLVGISTSGDVTCKAIKKYFKELGIKKVEIVAEKYGEEDLRMWIDNKLFIIEATGTEKKQNTESKAHQISKHIHIRQKENPNFHVYGLFISNHDNKKHFSKRNSKSFSKRLIRIAESHGYTVTTTLDLFNAFILIKKGQLTVNEFINMLCMNGEFKI